MFCFTVVKGHYSQEYVQSPEEGKLKASVTYKKVKASPHGEAFI